ncbi:MAG: 30S ribosomal protein S4 [Caldiserica bacterium]|nr:MAG: 30S ribosomal protein S4 [Caldisericota bacterium]
MARLLGPKCKKCRRFNQKLFLKGVKCFTSKCPLDPHHLPSPRTTRPGQHGAGAKAFSEYGIRLDEKQKLRFMYGVMEKQFKKYFEMAQRRKGVTGENLLIILESRLDNVLYRMGFALSRQQARQFIRHRFIEVNSKVIDIPSYLVKPGDVISLREKAKNKEIFKEIIEYTKENFQILPHLEVDFDNMKGKFLRYPERNEIPVDVNEQLIVEFYSR